MAVYSDGQEASRKEIEKITKDARIYESYLVGLLWSNPIDGYGEYGEYLQAENFIHDVWSFYFEIGRKMYNSGIKNFDPITVKTHVNEYGLSDDFDRFGKMQTIKEVVAIVENSSENIEYYYEKFTKNDTIRKLYYLFGEKVLLKRDKYNYEKMTKDDLKTYWNDKVNSISVGDGLKYEAEDLYIDPEKFIQLLEEDASDMLPYYKSKLLNSISMGVPRGHITMIGGYGGTGKTSFVVEKFITSAIENKEKTIILLNEETAQSFRQKVVLSILYHEFEGTVIDRRKMVNGGMDEEYKNKIRKAFARMSEMMDSENSIIKIIFMERYVIKELKNVVRYWVNRGYTNLIIDTHKVSDDSKHEARWVSFVEDTKEIYRWTRPNAGGLNLRTIITFQLSDNTMKNRYLDDEAIGEGKASKNEVSIVYMFRVAWADELEGGKNELLCWRNKKNPVTGKWEEENFKMKKGEVYYLLFTPKNRFGKDNDTGQPVLVLKPFLEANNFKEVGWCRISNIKSIR